MCAQRKIKIDANVHFKSVSSGIFECILKVRVNEIDREDAREYKHDDISFRTSTDWCIRVQLRSEKIRMFFFEMSYHSNQ